MNIFFLQRLLFPTGTHTLAALNSAIINLAECDYDMIQGGGGMILRLAADQEGGVPVDDDLGALRVEDQL